MGKHAGLFAFRNLKTGKPPVQRRLSKGGGTNPTILRPMNFNLSTASEAREQILARALSLHGIDKLDPILPEVDLQSVQDQFMEEGDDCTRTWDDWRHLIEAHVCESWREDPDETKREWEAADFRARKLSLMALPLDIRKGAHKLIFGIVTDKPTFFAIDVLATALFDGPDYWGRGRTWLCGLYATAQADHERRLKLQADVDHLLAALEV